MPTKDLDSEKAQFVVNGTSVKILRTIACEKRKF